MADDRGVADLLQYTQSEHDAASRYENV